MIARSYASENFMPDRYFRDPSKSERQTIILPFAERKRNIIDKLKRFSSPGSSGRNTAKGFNV